MKTTELMIGDWVKISHRNKIGTVYRIDRANEAPIKQLKHYRL